MLYFAYGADLRFLGVSKLAADGQLAKSRRAILRPLGICGADRHVDGLVQPQSPLAKSCPAQLGLSPLFTDRFPI